MLSYELASKEEGEKATVFHLTGATMVDVQIVAERFSHRSNEIGIVLWEHDGVHTVSISQNDAEVCISVPAGADAEEFWTEFEVAARMR